MSDQCSVTTGIFSLASLVAQTVKNLPVMWGTQGSIPGLGRYPGEGNGYTLQYYLENSMDREAWQATIHEVPKGYSPWGHKELNTTERLTLSLHFTSLRYLTTFKKSSISQNLLLSLSALLIKLDY